MKTLPLSTAAVAALFALAACNQQPEEVTSVAPDPLANEVASRAPVELPPSIEATASMRCKDNSLIVVEFYRGQKQVRIVKDGETNVGTLLKAPAAGEAYVAEGGYKLTGTAKKATIELPGKGARECHA